MLKIEEIANINSGVTIRKNQKFDYSESFKLIQVGDLDSNHTLVPSIIERVVEFEPKEQYVLNPGDVLFANKGEYNFASLVPDDIGDALASSTFLVLKNFDKRVIPEYVVWYINSSEGQRYLNSVRKGNTIPYISKKAFVKMPVIIPKISEQKLITKIDVLNRKENKLRSQILEKRKNMIEKQLINHINKKSTW